MSGPVAIADTVTGMLHAIDALDWEGVRRALADRVETDYTSLFGGAPAFQTADELILAWRGLVPGFQATQHLLGPIVVHEEGAAATAETHVRAYHYLSTQDGEAWTVAGHYRVRLVRDGRWRIVGIHVTTFHQDGSLKLVEVARERARSSPRKTKGPP